MKVVLPRIGALAIVVVLGWMSMAQSQPNSVRSATDEFDAASNGESTPANPLRDTTVPERFHRRYERHFGRQPGPAARGQPVCCAGGHSDQRPGSPRRRHRLAGHNGSSIPDASSLPFASQQNADAGQPANPPPRYQEMPAQAATEQQPRYAQATQDYPQGETRAAAERPAQQQPSRQQPKPTRYNREVTPVAAEQPISGPSLMSDNPVRPVADDRYAAPVRQSNAGPSAAAPSAEGEEPAPLKIDPFAPPANPLPKLAADQDARNLPLVDAQNDSPSAVS